MHDILTPAVDLRQMQSVQTLHSRTAPSSNFFSQVPVEDSAKVGGADHLGSTASTVSAPNADEYLDD